MVGSLAKEKFNKEIEKVRNLDKFSLQEIRKGKLSPFVKKFIIAEVSQIKDANSLDGHIENAIKLNINYALRPKWTMLNYLFGDKETKPVEEVNKKIKLFQFYRFYTNLIIDFIEDSSLSFITKGKTQELIDEANLVLYEKLTTKISSIKIKNFLLQVFKLKYLQGSDINLSSKIPFQFIRLFLEDKSFNELLKKFNIIDGLKDNYELELKTIIKILTDKYIIGEDEQLKFEEKKKKEIAGRKKEVKKVIKKEIKKSEVLDIEVESKPKKKDKDVIEIDFPKSTPKVKKIKTKEKPIYSSDLIKAKKEKIKRKKIKKDLPEKKIIDTLPKEKIRIKRLFKKDELLSIAKRVFKSSKFSMYRCFDELERYNNWEEASDFLKNLFIKNKVDLYNKDVVLFVDLLNDYYKNKEKNNS